VLPKHRLFPFVSAAPILLLPKLLPAAQCPTREDLDLIESANTRIERPAKWINPFSVTKNRTQTSTAPPLTTARPLETVSEQPASTDQPLDQSPSERGMEPINA
jgi:hypothetical protein